jgi:hypothetical protein
MLCGIPVMLSYQAGQPRLHKETAVLAKMFHHLWNERGRLRFPV